MLNVSLGVRSLLIEGREGRTFQFYADGVQRPYAILITTERGGVIKSAVGHLRDDCRTPWGWSSIEGLEINKLTDPAFTDKLRSALRVAVLD